MNIKNEIKGLIENSLKKNNFDFYGEIILEHPQDLKNGDFTTNIAMIIAGKNKSNPREIAQKILENFSENENIEKIEIAGPGYLNFFLSKKFFLERLKEQSLSVIKNGGILGVERGDLEIEGEKILFEHSSPNLFKPFHIGHMVNNSIGESLSRIFRFSGNEVINISFPSDVGPGIAKTIWGLNSQENSNPTLEEIAEAYVLGSKEYKENETVKKEVDEINSELYNEVQGENLELFEKGKKLSLEHFKEITKKLGSNFEEIIFESQAEKVGKEIIEKNIGKVFKESDGAVIFEGSKYGLFDNVYINSQGFGTYLAKDTGLLKIKKEKFSDFDKSFVITDIEQKQHFDLVKKSSSMIDEISDFTEKSKYLQHGRMTFSGNVKISSRYGNVPLAFEVIGTVKKNILEKMKDREFSEKEKDEISEKLSMATLKYSILKVTSGKNISFDIEKDTNPQGNSATFLLYTFVRGKSIFSKIDNFENGEVAERVGEISDLERNFYKFNFEIEKSQNDFSPHHLANYLYDLAKKFNSFYESEIILDEKNPDYFYNLKVVEKFLEIMENGLELLGIERVEKM